MTLVRIVLMMEIDEKAMERGMENGYFRTNETVDSVCDSFIETANEWLDDPEGVVAYQPEGSHYKKLEEVE